MNPDTTVYHTDLVLDEIRDNPSGRDVKHLNEEYVTFKNAGDGQLSISGWAVRNEAGNEFRFPDHTILDPGDRVTLYSGPGTNTQTEFYWGGKHPRWDNLEDTVTVVDADGKIRIRESYNE